jgi:hypothetical protein
MTYSPHCFAALFVNLAAIMPTVKISSFFNISIWNFQVLAAFGPLCGFLRLWIECVIVRYATHFWQFSFGSKKILYYFLR